MKKLVKVLMMSCLSLFTAVSAHAAKPQNGVHYANATNFNMDPKLPEPFSRSQAAQVIVDLDEESITLVFLMSDSEGINITFPLVSDLTDACGNRELIAAPPAGSTPYYKDFEIKVIDYTENNCASVKVPAPTFASLKSYEVRHKATTYSTLFAPALQVAPKESH
jgi:hypothetical protein